jgi:hypothetical protein
VMIVQGKTLPLQLRLPNNTFIRYTHLYFSLFQDMVK